MAQISLASSKAVFESWGETPYVSLRKVKHVVETVLFAMVAAFLGLRLYAVLGKRSGHEHTMRTPAEEHVANPVPVPAPDGREATLPRANPADPFDSNAIPALRAISQADSQFNPADFIEGAKSAYGMILTAFWKGEEEALAPYVSQDVHASFASAIKAREAAGEVVDNRLVRIDHATISAANLDGRVARVTVRFDADIAAITRDLDGTVVAGSLTDAIETHDEWTFERDVRSSDPNWILVDTDEAA